MGPMLPISTATLWNLFGRGSISVAHSDHKALGTKELEVAVLDYRRLIAVESKMEHLKWEEI